LENPRLRFDLMIQTDTPLKRHSNVYNLFILVLTIFSLIIMVVMLFPLDPATINLLQVYDNLICVIFLVDFSINLIKAKKKSDYFIKERGWLDLLGSIPSLGLAFKYSGLFRLARLSRFVRIARAMRGEKRGAILADIIRNRGNYTAAITIMVTLIVLSVSSVLVLQFESHSAAANIKSGGDAFWYSVVTITTVGYGDRYPVTAGGRITAIFIMFTGVGIIGVLASLLSSVLIGSKSDEEEAGTPTPVSSSLIEQELTTIKNELAELRQLLEKTNREADQK
jgi:voltage-gated potassium channel